MMVLLVRERKPVAKKKPEDKPDDDATVYLQVSCKGAFWKWVHQLAQFDDRPMSTVVRRAIRLYAESVKFKKPPEE